MKPIPTHAIVVRIFRCLAILSASTLFVDSIHAQGARHFKSGPIQITANGQWVWVANRDNSSVSRMDTSTEQVTEIVLPDIGTAHSPRGLAVTEDGSEI